MELVGLENKGILIVLDADEMHALYKAIGPHFLKDSHRPYQHVTPNGVTMSQKDRKTLFTVADAIEDACSRWGNPINIGEVRVVETDGNTQD